MDIYIKKRGWDQLMKPETPRLLSESSAGGGAAGTKKCKEVLSAYISLLPCWCSCSETPQTVGGGVKPEVLILGADLQSDTGAN